MIIYNRRPYTAVQVFTKSSAVHNNIMSKLYYSFCSENQIKGHELVNRFEHAGRNKLYNLSRLALAQTIQSVTQQQIHFQTIQLQGYHKLTNFEHLTCSLTHSRGCAAALLADRIEAKGVGIDLELKSRDVTSGSERFFINPQDQFNTDELLLQWCIKEACFKALANAGEKIELLKDVIVEKERFYFESVETVEKNHYTIIEDQEKFIVLAICGQNNITAVEIIETTNH